MHCYKLNNSYTVYVNYAYINECIKASKKYATGINKTLPKRNQKRSMKITIPKLGSVYHKLYGEGSVIETNNNGIITVQFASKTSKFIYPDAFEKGYLK